MTYSEPCIVTYAGPCIICGDTNYALSCGGPTICPKCDCGNFDVATVDKQATVIAALRVERDDLKSDYLRRHHDACDYWMALKLIADGYGPNHGSKYCRDMAQAALDQANRRTSEVPQANVGSEKVSGK